MSTMTLVSETVHYDHGSGNACTMLLVTRVINPGSNGMNVDGIEVGLNLLGIIIQTARQNVANDPANSNGTWHYKGDCTR